MSGWLCNFIPCRLVHIAGHVWQCTRCKSCVPGYDARKAVKDRERHEAMAMMPRPDFDHNPT